jgi:hypothetical protein
MLVVFLAECLYFTIAVLKPHIMERIEALINRLKEQFDLNTDPSVLLGTVQLLQFELTKMNSSQRPSLGTSKVAVVLPSAQITVTAAGENYEKYAPKPVEDIPAVKEVKETFLLDEGSISVVQRNGQLDMVFDPMSEIPTFSQQNRQIEKEVNDSTAPSESLNDKLRQGKTELVEVLKETPVKDLRKAIGINDRFHFINELFRGDESMYERCIKTINSFNIYAEAEYWITRELKVKLGWEDSQPAAEQFYQLVKRRFS